MSVAPLWIRLSVSLEAQACRCAVALGTRESLPHYLVFHFVSSVSYQTHRGSDVYHAEPCVDRFSFGTTIISLRDKRVGCTLGSMLSAVAGWKGLAVGARVSVSCSSSGSCSFSGFACRFASVLWYHCVPRCVLVLPSGRIACPDTKVHACTCRATLGSGHVMLIPIVILLYRPEGFGASLGYPKCPDTANFRFHVPLLRGLIAEETPPSKICSGRSHSLWVVASLELLTRGGRMRYQWYAAGCF